MNSRRLIGLASFFLLAAVARASDNPPPEVLKDLDFFEHMDLVQDPDFLKSHIVAVNDVVPSTATTHSDKEGKS